MHRTGSHPKKEKDENLTVKIRQTPEPSCSKLFVSLTSSLVVKMLTVQVSTISNSQVVLPKKKKVSDQGLHCLQIIQPFFSRNM